MESATNKNEVITQVIDDIESLSDQDKVVIEAFAAGYRSALQNINLNVEKAV